MFSNKSNIKSFVKPLFNTIMHYIYWLIFLYHTYLSKPVINKPKVPSAFDLSMKKYQEFYTTASSENIDPVLYNYDERKELFVDPDNVHEKQWKSRVLYTNSPRGNVLMYYNPFTLSFVYHSDEQVIPFATLQQLATKYVVMFRCKDFFIDPVNSPANKMLDLLKKEEDALKSKKMKVEDITKCVDKIEGKDVFASLKDYRAPTKATTKSTPSVPASSQMGAKAVLPNKDFSNKFVRIGKINEFNVLCLPPSKKVQMANELLFGDKPMNAIQDFFDDLDIVENPFSTDEPAVEKVSSYAMFKKLKTASA